MELVDCHTHSAYSGHGSGTVAELVARAEELGLSTFAQTEHLCLPDGMDPTFETSMSPETYRSYIEELAVERERLQRSSSPMELVFGIEADWLAGRRDELERLCAPFEHVLGSVHFVDRRPFDDPGDMSVWDDYGIDRVWERYLELWLDMVANHGPITCFAHPDLPKLYGWHPSFDLRERYLEMARAVAASGCMVEVNTAGMRKDVREMYPALELLREFAAAGVDCTVGSDAHSARDVARGIRDAYALMRKAGYGELAVPCEGGERRYIALDI